MKRSPDQYTLTTGQALKIFGGSRHNFNAAVERGELSYKRVGRQGRRMRRYYNKEEVQKWADSHVVQVIDAIAVG